ncbi:hypothetical protein GCM10028792_08320 [Salinisphaera aquimarina]
MVFLEQQRTHPCARHDVEARTADNEDKKNRRDHADSTRGEHNSPTIDSPNPSFIARRDTRPPLPQAGLRTHE